MAIDPNPRSTARPAPSMDPASESTTAATHGADHAPLVFVTGASRSGTTMLARILGGHDAILALQELHYFGSLWDPARDPQSLPEAELVRLGAILVARQIRGLWAGEPTAAERDEARRTVMELPADQRTPAGLFAAIVQALAFKAGKQCACEQTPRNIFYARRLLDLYPAARIVHIVRDPRAVLASQKNRWKLRALGAEHLPVREMIRNRVNYHPLTIGKLWNEANEEAWRLRGHARFHLVRFEDLAAAPEAELSKLCAFLGIDVQPAMLDLPRWGSSNLAHSSDQRGISREVVDRWSQVLSHGEILVCEQVTRRMMQPFGYQCERLGTVGRARTIPVLLSYPLHLLGVVALNPRRAWTQLKALRQANRSTA